MKIGYFGTPSHSAELLQALLKEGFDIEFVVTNIDKPTGRKKILTPTPVKEIALKNNIPVEQFVSIKTPEAIEKINSYSVDIQLVFAYGAIIPRAIFEKPKLGTINLHGSLLPEFRGASPVQAAILADKKITGYSLQYITEELDAGDIISSGEVNISDEDTFASLLQKITQTGIEDLIRLLKTNPTEMFPSTSQDHSKASKCGKIKSEDRKLDFSQNARDLHNKIRAFNPDHLCYFEYKGKRINCLTSKVLDITCELEAGSIYHPDKKTFALCCGDKKLLGLVMIQPENKNPMSVVDFINGSKPIHGEKVN